MNAEIIIASLLSHSSIVALVGNRRAMTQLPQNSEYPALVYTLIDGVPNPELSYQLKPQRATARVQINPLATTPAVLKSLHGVVRSVLDFKHQTVVSGKLVVSCRFENMGPATLDNDIKIWTQSADYILQYYE